MLCVEGIKLTECNEMIDSDYRRNLIDIEMVFYFAEELFDMSKRRRRTLSPNRKSHRNYLNRCEELLDFMSVENALNSVEG